jgi:flagellar assembly factor FliW
MSANLKAPIIINNKTKNARQIVLQDSKLEVRFKMYMDLKKYIVNYASDDSKRTNISDSSVRDQGAAVVHAPTAQASSSSGSNKNSAPEAN